MPHLAEGEASRIKPNPILGLAEQHAGLGTPVFPVRVDGDSKRPLTAHGHLDASTDIRSVRRMFNKAAGCNAVGVTLGDGGWRVLGSDAAGDDAEQAGDEDSGADSNEVLTWACRYAYTGMAVLAVHGVTDEGACTCGDPHDGSGDQRLGPKAIGKHPVHGVMAATTDLAVIEGWFLDRPELNIGIAAGERSNLVVLDVDGEVGRATLAALAIEHGPLPSTLRAITGREDGGEHLFFGLPDDRRIGQTQLGPGIDTRSTNGYVVVAPSRHRSGARYRWLNWGAGRVVLPDWAASQLEPSKIPDRHFGPAPEAISDAELDALRLPAGVQTRLLSDTPRDGHRSEQQFAMVAALVDCGLDDDQIRACIWRHAPSVARGEVDRHVRLCLRKLRASEGARDPSVAGMERFTEVGERPGSQVPPVGVESLWERLGRDPDLDGRVDEAAKALSLQRDLTERLMKLVGLEAPAPYERSQFAAKAEDLLRPVPEVVFHTAWDRLGVVDETIDWLITGVIQTGSRDVTGGVDKSLKSVFSVAKVAAVASGRPFLGYPGFEVPVARSCIVLVGEGGERLFVKRLRREWAFLGLGGDELKEAAMRVRYAVVAGLPPEEFVRRISQEAERICSTAPGDLGLVLVDPLYIFQGEASSSQLGEMGRLLGTWSGVVESFGAVLSVTGHMRKNPSDPLVLLALTGVGLPSWAGSWWLIDPTAVSADANAFTLRVRAGNRESGSVDLKIQALGVNVGEKRWIVEAMSDNDVEAERKNQAISDKEVVAAIEVGMARDKIAEHLQVSPEGHDGWPSFDWIKKNSGRGRADMQALAMLTETGEIVWISQAGRRGVYLGFNPKHPDHPDARPLPLKATSATSRIPKEVQRYLTES